MDLDFAVGEVVVDAGPELEPGVEGWVFLGVDPAAEPVKRALPVEPQLEQKVVGDPPWVVVARHQADHEVEVV